jgi:predicted TIM-barrel fold metal-dependent hydrolase
MIISGDCHAGARQADYSAYLDPAYRDRYDAVMADESLVARRSAEVIGMHMSSSDGDDEHAPLTAQWDAERRLGQLDADGIAAEVIFPQPAGRAAPPFYNIFGHPLDPSDPGAAVAGCRAYNRWLADFCADSPTPERHAGLALVGAVDDVDAVVAEIEWAKRAGLRGIILRSQPLTGHGWHEPRYEPIWAVCEDLEMPIHTHGGEGPELGDYPGSSSIFFTEVVWFAHRLFWFLLWSGALERHPRLRLVLTEQFADWVPDLLRRLDAQYEGTVSNITLSEGLSMKPSEYWARQCSVGASFMSRLECDRRHAIGIENILWGSDFPHDEGTWPNTHESLHTTFDGVPEDELRAMLGGNALRVYGFEEEVLLPHASRVGPSVESFRS